MVCRVNGELASQVNGEFLGAKSRESGAKILDFKLILIFLAPDPS